MISIWLTAIFLLTKGFPDPVLPGHYQTLLTADSSLATGPELSHGFIYSVQLLHG